MNIILTGAAGFIGFHTTLALLKKKINVYGIDDLNPYYDVRLKKDRLAILKKYENFHFLKKKIEDKKIHSFFKKKDIDVIINLAAQAGVRHSLKNPCLHESNVLGQVNLLELARLLNVKNLFTLVHHLFMEVIRICHFLLINALIINFVVCSLKKSTELVAECYSHLFNMKCIGLRFLQFMVHGKTYMATFIFTKTF